MNKLMRFCNMVMAVLVLMLMTGCPKYVGGPPPQSREQFVKTYKDGAGPFGGVEHYSVDRPLNAVVADITQYANSCLKMRASHKLQGESRHWTTYNPKVAAGSNGVTMLSLQKIFDDKVDKQEPPGGLYTLVAEFRSAGGAKTNINVYRTGDRDIAEGLKAWANGEKNSCPSLI